MAFLDLAPTTAAEARASYDTWLSLLAKAETEIAKGNGDPAALPGITSARDAAKSARDQLPAGDGAPVSDIDKGNIGSISALSELALASANVHYDGADAVKDTAAIVAAKIQAAAAAGGLALIKALWPILLILVLVLAVVIAAKRRPAT